MTDEPATEHEWDAEWTRINEFDVGVHSGFSEFADAVVQAMEEAGNDVERPCVMRVTVQVSGGKLKRPEGGVDAE